MTGVNSPAAAPSSAAKTGEVGERCLSEASLARRPAWGAAEGTRQGAAGGVFFFDYFLVDEHKKVIR